MLIEIITPDKKLFDGEARLVKLPGVEGSFEILKNHAPLISLLEKGEIKIVGENNETTMVPIKGGMVEVNDNKVSVLAYGSGPV